MNQDTPSRWRVEKLTGTTVAKARPADPLCFTAEIGRILRKSLLNIQPRRRI